MSARFFIVVLLLINSLTALAQESGLARELNNIVAQRIPKADVGIIVADANTGHILYERQGFKAFTPGSTLKLLTAVASLYALGADFRFQTTASINKKQLQKGMLNGNLTLTFSGDPSLTVHQLNKLLHDIKRYGIKKITGNIVIDDTQFSPPNYGPGWSVDDLGWYYTAPITSVILDENANIYEFVPSQSLGGRTKLVPQKKSPFIRVTSNVKTVTEDDAEKYCSLVLRIDNHDNAVDATGCWPISQKAETERISLANPNHYAMQLIRRGLHDNGITFNGKFLVKKGEGKLTVIAKRQSKPLKQLLKWMLKSSDNLYADSLLKTLGAVYYGQGNFKSGTLAMRTILIKQAGINFDQTRLADGSGLSRYNLITPQVMNRLLYVVQQTPELRKVIKPALPFSGKDGSLSRRMRAFDLIGQLKAKTGSMSGLIGLSGYLTTKNNQELLFTIMVNRMVGTLHDAAMVQEEIASRLYTYAG